MKGGSLKKKATMTDANSKSGESNNTFSGDVGAAAGNVGRDQVINNHYNQDQYLPPGFEMMAALAKPFITSNCNNQKIQFIALAIMEDTSENSEKITKQMLVIKKNLRKITPHSFVNIIFI